ncbi:hypothetical protein [Bacillus solimangrovi]|uniref:Uncharacterized protein n=1 Tax=Bacillus solimangrovi TaxID=1305675 RepID=A0A1E5LC39_9BACI|nr:hypothetical protein [Bacillus solimangrovi]OEH91633.1 hypothetical protein BFG57_04485 [Bacillus solimangrovi]
MSNTSKELHLPLQPFMMKLGFSIAASYGLWFIAALTSGEDIGKQIGGLLFGGVLTILFFLFTKLGISTKGKKIVIATLIVIAVTSYVFAFVIGSSNGGH